MSTAVPAGTSGGVGQTAAGSGGPAGSPSPQAPLKAPAGQGRSQAGPSRPSSTSDAADAAEFFGVVNRSSAHTLDGDPAAAVESRDDEGVSDAERLAAEATNDLERRAERQMAREAGLGSEGEGEGQEAGEPEPEAQADPAEEGSEAFEFAGQKFASVQAAEAEFKRALGRLKAQGSQVSQMQAALRDAVHSAIAWQKHAQQGGQAGAPAQTGQTGPSNASPSNDGQAGDQGPTQSVLPLERLHEFADSVDWQAYREIEGRHGPEIAQNWLMRKFARGMQQAVSQALETQLSPFRSFHEQMASVQQANAVFEAAAEAVDQQTGEALYPELAEGADPDAVGRIVTLFQTLTKDGMPQNMAVHFAVLEHRRLYPGGTGRGAAGTANTNQRGATGPAVRGNGVGAQLRRAAAAASAAHAGLASAPAGSPLRQRGNAPGDLSDELSADFKRAQSRVNTFFGVAR